MKEVKQTGRFVVVFVAQLTRACIERIIQASYRFNLHTKYIAEKKTEKKRSINIHPQEIPAICKYWSNRTSNLVSGVPSLPPSREGPGDEVAGQDGKKESSWKMKYLLHFYNKYIKTIVTNIEYFPPAPSADILFVSKECNPPPYALHTPWSPDCMTRGERIS